MAWRSCDYYLVSTSNPDNQAQIEVNKVLGEAVAPFAELPAGWRCQCGTWEVASNGAISGRGEGTTGAILWFLEGILGDHMVELQACSVPPNANDLNCMWEGSGQYSDINPEDFCKIGGVGGWWHGFNGIESATGNVSGAALRSIAAGGGLIVGQIHEIAAGRVQVDGQPNDFLFVNGQLVTQLTDPIAQRRKVSKVAVSTYDSHINVFALRVSQVSAGKAIRHHRLTEAGQHRLEGRRRSG